MPLVFCSLVCAPRKCRPKTLFGPYSRHITPDITDTPAETRAETRVCPQSRPKGCGTSRGLFACARRPRAPGRQRPSGQSPRRVRETPRREVPQGARGKGPASFAHPAGSRGRSRKPGTEPHSATRKPEPHSATRKPEPHSATRKPEPHSATRKPEPQHPYQRSLSHP